MEQVTETVEKWDNDNVAVMDETEMKMFRQEIQRLKLELSMKKEEARSLAETALDNELVTKEDNQRSNLSSSLIHDMSVDDRVIEEVMKSSMKPLLITPSRRGPSASSTPQKESIGEELRGLSPWLPSPFCEKLEMEEGHLASCPKAQVFKLQEVLAERMRKLVCDQVGEGGTAQAMATVNEAFADCRTGTQRCLEVLLEDSELIGENKKTNNVSGKRHNKEEADNLSVNSMEIAQSRKEVENVQTRVSALVSLLRAANDTLLATSTGDPTPDCSLHPEIDLSSWQLDLEGIQLLERGQPLAKRLAQYSLHGR